MKAAEQLQSSSSEIVRDVTFGLQQQPKALPPWLFYDAEGSRLFEEITRLPEYYLTRTERDILWANAEDILWHAGARLALIELGAGTATKTGILIRALLRQQKQASFYPVDVSGTALDIAQTRLQREFPALTVSPMLADYTDGFRVPSAAGEARLVLYLGSSIGNFEPEIATAILRRIRLQLTPGDCLLLGVDRQKSRDIMLPAYDDSRGVTASFNRNVLARINRELRGHFNLDNFRHAALWNAHASRVEMHLVSTCEQRVRIDAIPLEVTFRSGEHIHTENSYKYSPAMLTTLLDRAGFRLERTWTDRNEWFSLHLARVD